MPRKARLILPPRPRRAVLAGRQRRERGGLLFATACSGINACACAWIPLGWEEAFCAEIEPFPAAVLAHRFGSGRPEVMPDPCAPGLKRKDSRSRAAAIRAIAKNVPGYAGGPPNLGDMTRHDFVARARQVLAGRRLDVLCAGTPCQGYSVAGLRGSMQDPRSNLMFCFVEAYHGLDSTWALWENVPGCLNTPDNAFGTLLGGLSGASSPLVSGDPGRPGKWASSGIFQGPKAGGAWRVLDAQHVGGCEVHGPSAVPQRRERLFVVVRAGATGSTRAAQALFEPQGEGRDPAAQRQAGANVTAYAGRGSRGVSHALKAHGNLKLAPDHETYVVEVGGGKARRSRVAPTLDGRCKNGPVQNQLGACVVTGRVTHALKAEGADGSEDGTGRGTPIVVIQEQASKPHKGRNGIGFREGGVAYTLEARRAQAIAFGSKDSGQDASDKVAPTLRAGGHTESHKNGGVPPAVVYDMRGRGAGDVSPTLLTDHASRPSDFCPIVFEPRIARNGSGKPSKVAPTLKVHRSGGAGDAEPVVVFETRFARNGRGAPGKIAPPMKAQNGGTGKGDGAAVIAYHACHEVEEESDGYVVRRFTCRECERLQAFPDDWTLIPWPGTRKQRDLDEQVAYLLGSGYALWAANVLALCPDGPRYKSIGNSKAVSVVQWLGRRIQEVEQR